MHILQSLQVCVCLLFCTTNTNILILFHLVSFYSSKQSTIDSLANQKTNKKMTTKMEVVEESAASPTPSRIGIVDGSRQEETLYATLKSLQKQQQKYESVALTMEALFKDNLATLTRLFEFYKSNKRSDMAYQLCANQLLKNFDLTKPNLFDDDLFRFARSIVDAAKKEEKTNEEDNFYSDVFDQLSPQLQQKLLQTILDRLKSGQFGFLRNFSNPTSDETKPGGARPGLTATEMNEFYDSLGKNKDYLILMRDLLVRRPSFIEDQGLFMIDAFLNLEKHAFLPASSSGDSTERRSLNVMRRVCVVELIPRFVSLIEKLDNRHCYRWIEKSLEFYTKYTIAAIRVNKQENNNNIPFTYLPISLINVKVNNPNIFIKRDILRTKEKAFCPKI